MNQLPSNPFPFGLPGLPVVPDKTIPPQQDPERVLTEVLGMTKERMDDIEKMLVANNVQDMVGGFSDYINNGKMKVFPPSE